MNTEYYRILLRTVEIGNITKAAELLGYTQSGISRIMVPPLIITKEDCDKAFAMIKEAVGELSA